jgi:hypothetical protein
MEDQTTLGLNGQVKVINRKYVDEDDGENSSDEEVEDEEESEEEEGDEGDNNGYMALIDDGYEEVGTSMTDKEGDDTEFGPYLDAAIHAAFDSEVAGFSSSVGGAPFSAPDTTGFELEEQSPFDETTVFQDLPPIPTIAPLSSERVAVIKQTMASLQIKPRTVMATQMADSIIERRLRLGDEKGDE